MTLPLHRRPPRSRRGGRRSRRENTTSGYPEPAAAYACRTPRLTPQLHRACSCPSNGGLCAAEPGLTLTTGERSRGLHVRHHCGLRIQISHPRLACELIDFLAVVARIDTTVTLVTSDELEVLPLDVENQVARTQLGRYVRAWQDSQPAVTMQAG